MLENLLDPKSTQHVLGVVVLLLGTVLASLTALQWFQRWARGTQEDDTESGRGDWENALAGYKNLRDQGVLSEEEYRKIRTLAEPHLHAPRRRDRDPAPWSDHARGAARDDVPDRPGAD
jgi:hypothetical protein